MGYLWFLLLVLCSFVMAAEETPTLGEVRIIGAKPATIDPVTQQKIPNSDLVILKIKQVTQDQNTGSVSLVAASEDPYDVVQVTFDAVQHKDLTSLRFRNYLEKNEGFIAVVNAKNVQLDTSKFVSALFVSGKNVMVRAPAEPTVMALNTVLCDYKNVRSLPWTEGELVRENCL